MNVLVRWVSAWVNIYNDKLLTELPTEIGQNNDRAWKLMLELRHLNRQPAARVLQGLLPPP